MLRRFGWTSAVLALAACGAQPDRPTAVPAAGAVRSVSDGAACGRDAGTSLVDRVSTLFATSVQTEARRLARRAVQRCPDKGAVLDYVQQVLAWRATPGLVVGTATQQWTYLDDLFRLIGFRIDNTEGALGQQGFIAVCANGVGCEAVTPLRTSGIKIFRGALGGAADNRFLVTGAPTPCSDIDGYTDLQVWSQCVEISVDPKTGNSFRFAAPADPAAPAPAIVQTCLSHTSYHLAQYLTGTVDSPILSRLPDGNKPRIRLAQRSGAKTDPVAPVKLRPRPGDGTPFENGFIQDAGDGCEAATAATALAAPSGPLGLAARWFGALGRAAGRAFAPATLYAAHGGLGSLPGLVEEVSRFGPADPFVFEATFDNRYPNAQAPSIVRSPDVPGQQPVSDDLGRAAWFIDFEAPGSVRVQSAALGDLAGAPNQFVVVNQAGGASAGKRGVTMLANLAFFSGTTPQNGVQASFGKYRLRWTSLVSTPRVGQQAPFVALSPDPARPGEKVEIARFAYENGSRAQSGPISFGGRVVPGLTWQQNVKQRFEILVDLGAAGAAAYFRTVNLATGEPSTYRLGTVQQTAGALQLVQAGWLFKGRDNQVVGMDDFEMVRLADSFPVPAAAP